MCALIQSLLQALGLEGVLPLLYSLYPPATVQAILDSCPV